MFRIGSVNCEDFAKICEKEGITSFPGYKVYPPIPAPPVEYYQAEGKEIDIDALKKTAYRYIGNRVIDISA